MMHPVEDVLDWESSPSKCRDLEKGRRSSWMARRSPFRSTMASSNRDRDMVLSPESCERSPLRKTAYALLSTPTPSLSSPLLLREKLLNSLPKHVSNKSSSSKKDMNENMTLEGLDDVYENVETLLEVLRMERHQDKLRAEEEIKQLKERLAIYEGQQESSNSLSISPSSVSKLANAELLDSLMDTLALLEDECLEWQTASVNNSCKPPRPSLGNVTNQQLSPSPQKQQQQATPPYKTPRQKNLERSIQRLRAASSLLRSCQRKSLTVTFDQQATVCEEQSESEDDPLVGLRVLEDHQPSETESMSESDMDALLAMPAATPPTTPTASITSGTINDSPFAMEEEAHNLRKQLWNQMMAHSRQVRSLTEEIQSIQKEKDGLESTVANREDATKALKQERKKVISLNNTCQELRDQAAKHEGIVKQYQLQLTALEKFSQDLMETSCRQLHTKDRELLRIQTHLMTVQERMVSEAARSQLARKNMPEELLKLRERVCDLELQTAETDRHQLDLKMQLGIARHARLATNTKLETARVKVNRQAATIEHLEAELAESKRMTRAYSSQVEYLSDELQRAQMEARESLEDRNHTVQMYRMDVSLLREDLNSSFHRL
ncbi:expressed unknown protein [Seminavis robusta]|uniref:Uncharacterized protein n=1 Tax=Seminavis robusta TaxID=568900 RepID=A0A9N8DYA3_9STRA|nr:expressed unknown protein [Seminavis robusta]|eukprot:Sro387_g132080.1 n/a (609) ;mRNA; f:33349-35175